MVIMLGTLETFEQLTYTRRTFKLRQRLIFLKNIQ